MKPSFSKLGEFVRHGVDESGRSAATLKESRTRFELAVMERREMDQAGWLSRHRSHVRAALLSAAVVAAGLFVAGRSDWAFLGASKAPLSVALESNEADLVGAWVKADEETKQLRFSEGTSLSLHPHTKLRVREVTESGATIDLGEGRTLARIVPLKDASWRFLAGPFLVRVTGTEFDLAWDPQAQTLELALHQGSVMLSGPTLDGEKAVRKGQFVRVSVPESDGAAESTQDDSAGDTPGADRTEPKDAEEARAAKGASSPTAETASPQPTGAGQATWGEKLRSGTAQEAVEAIEKEGSAGVLARASSAQLWSIASKARLGGRPTLARDALLALRTRHGTRGQTAYLLGKVHADQLGATSQAIKWFEVYLKEAPGGKLSEQALGRLVELQAGTRAGKSAARRYLERYPTGSYAKFCRSQLR